VIRVDQAPILPAAKPPIDPSTERPTPRVMTGRWRATYSLAMAQRQRARATQVERSGRSAKALLDAASELIVEGGFGSLTFASIGERAGYSRGLVTSRFGSKDGLVEALIERVVNTWGHRNVIPYTEGKSGLAGVTIMLEAIRRQSARDSRGLRVLYALMFEAVGSDDALLRVRMADLNAEMRCDFAKFIDRGLSDGSVSSGISPNAEAALIIAALRGIGYQWLLDPNRFNPVSSLAYLRDVTLDRLAAPGHRDDAGDAGSDDGAAAAKGRPSKTPS